MNLVKAITDELICLIKQLMQDPLLSDFYLVGGTGLALHLKHRKSADIYLFCDAGFESQSICSHLEQKYQAYSLIHELNTARCQIKGIKVEFQSHFEHKRKMRELMAAELDKNVFLEANYDGWGNKVTIYSDDIDKKIAYPGPWDIPIIKKDSNASIDDLSIQTDILRQMNCQYLFSALPIMNHDAIDLQYEKSFENVDSPYRVYLYSVTPSQTKLSTAGVNQN